MTGFSFEMIMWSSAARHLHWQENQRSTHGKIRHWQNLDITAKGNRSSRCCHRCSAPKDVQISIFIVSYQHWHACSFQHIHIPREYMRADEHKVLSHWAFFLCLVRVNFTLQLLLIRNSEWKGQDFSLAGWSQCVMLLTAGPEQSDWPDPECS